MWKVCLSASFDKSCTSLVYCVVVLLSKALSLVSFVLLLMFCFVQRTGLVEPATQYTTDVLVSLNCL